MVEMRDSCQGLLAGLTHQHQTRLNDVFVRHLYQLKVKLREQSLHRSSGLFGAISFDGALH